MRMNQKLKSALREMPPFSTDAELDAWLISQPSAMSHLRQMVKASGYIINTNQRWIGVGPEAVSPIGRPLLASRQELMPFLHEIIPSDGRSLTAGKIVRHAAFRSSVSERTMRDFLESITKDGLCAKEAAGRGTAWRLVNTPV